MGAPGFTGLAGCPGSHPSSSHGRGQPPLTGIPDDDRILDPQSMRASAEKAGDRLEIVTVPGSSYFVLFDEPRLFDRPRARRRWRTGHRAIGGGR